MSFSASPHVDLLQQYYAHKLQPHAEEQPQHILHLLSPTPALTNTDASAGNETSTLDASSPPLPLPACWRAIRSSLLQLPCERRLLPTLRIDTNNPHALRRGLWLACACMYLPDIVGLKEEEHQQQDQNNNNTNQLSSSSNSSSSPVIVTPIPSPSLASIDSLVVPSTFEISVVEGGITNQLYKCSLSTHPDQPVLVRIYGQNTGRTTKSNRKVVLCAPFHRSHEHSLFILLFSQVLALSL